MKHPLDKLSRDYAALLVQQASDLTRWASVLRPEVYQDLEQYCRGVNRPVSQTDLTARSSLSAYKAGGIHVCPVGLELYQILFDRQRFDEAVQYVASSTERLLQTIRTSNMNDIQKKFEQVAALFIEIGGLLASAPAAAPAAAEASPQEQLAALAARKDPKLVTKLLGKIGADSIEEVEDSDIEKLTSKLEALDDVAAEEEEPKGKKGKAKGDDDEPTISLDALRALAEELITDGKSSAIKKILSKHGSESLTKLAEDQYEAVHAKLTALKD